MKETLVEDDDEDEGDDGMRESEKRGLTSVLSARTTVGRFKGRHSPLPCEGEEEQTGVATNIGEANAASHVVPAGGAAVVPQMTRTDPLSAQQDSFWCDRRQTTSPGLCFGGACFVLLPLLVLFGGQTRTGSVTQKAEAWPGLRTAAIPLDWEWEQEVGGRVGGSPRR